MDIDLTHGNYRVCVKNQQINTSKLHFDKSSKKTLRISLQAQKNGQKIVYIIVPKEFKYDILGAA
jgi:hypothetical protein